LTEVALGMEKGTDKMSANLTTTWLEQQAQWQNGLQPSSTGKS